MIGLPKSARTRIETKSAAPATPGLARGKVIVLNNVKPVAPRFRPAYSRLGEIDCKTPSIINAATGKNAIVSESHNPCQPKILIRNPNK